MLYQNQKTPVYAGVFFVLVLFCSPPSGGEFILRREQRFCPQGEVAQRAEGGILVLS